MMRHRLRTTAITWGGIFLCLPLLLVAITGADGMGSMIESSSTNHSVFSFVLAPIFAGAIGWLLLRRRGR